MVAEGTANSLGPRIRLSSSTQFLIEHRTKKAAPRDPKDDEWRCSIQLNNRGKAESVQHSSRGAGNLDYTIPDRW